jgi:hypothetical protein
MIGHDDVQRVFRVADDLGNVHPHQTGVNQQPEMAFFQKRASSCVLREDAKTAVEFLREVRVVSREA